MCFYGCNSDAYCECTSTPKYCSHMVFIILIMMITVNMSVSLYLCKHSGLLRDGET